MWVLRDNATVTEVQQWAKEKMIIDMEKNHKKIHEILSMAYLWWFLSIMYAIGPRRILRYIQNTADVVLNMILVMFILKVIVWYFKVDIQLL